MQRLSGLLAVTALTVLILALAQMAPAAAPTIMFVATNLVGLGDGSSWANATNNLQGAIDVIDPANPTNTVWVSNGVYAVGGVINYPTGTFLTNRIAIWKPITVRSANNDPTNTIIKGVWDSLATTNGPAAVRCVWMTNNSTLIGFILTNGATLTTGTDDRYGGGVWCQSTNTVISNCVIAGNAASYAAGGAYYGALYNCMLSGNSARYGGGARYSVPNNCTIVSNKALEGGGTRDSTLYYCTIISNLAYTGGGVQNSTLYNCTLTGNKALRLSALEADQYAYGGGANASILYNCTLSGNYGSWGGGAMSSTLSNCTVIGNSVLNTGGGTYSNPYTNYNCTIVSNYAPGGGGGVDLGCHYNCTIVGNSAGGAIGGGAYRASLYNCTVVGNYAGGNGGGVWDGKGPGTNQQFVNCIIYFNSSATIYSNWYNVYSVNNFTNSCTSPNQAGWADGNITNDPRLVNQGSDFGTNHIVGNYRLGANSPCINAGTNFPWMTDPADVRSKDLDGRPRVRYGKVDMGAYERINKGAIYSSH